MRNRTSSFLLRFTPEELAALREYASEEGISCAEYIRRAIASTRIQRGSVEVSIFDAKARRAIELELIRQGTNLNQGIAALNTIARIFRGHENMPFYSQETIVKVKELSELARPSLLGAARRAEELKDSVTHELRSSAILPWSLSPEERS